MSTVSEGMLTGAPPKSIRQGRPLPPLPGAQQAITERDGSEIVKRIGYTPERRSTSSPRKGNSPTMGEVLATVTAKDAPPATRSSQRTPVSLQYQMSHRPAGKDAELVSRRPEAAELIAEANAPLSDHQREREPLASSGRTHLGEAQHQLTVAALMRQVVLPESGEEMSPNRGITRPVPYEDKLYVAANLYSLTTPPYESRTHMRNPATIAPGDGGPASRVPAAPSSPMATKAPASRHRASQSTSAANAGPKKPTSGAGGPAPRPPPKPAALFGDSSESNDDAPPVPRQTHQSTHERVVVDAVRTLEFDTAGKRRKASVSSVTGDTPLVRGATDAPGAPRRPSTRDAKIGTLLFRDENYNRVVISNREAFEWDVLCQYLSMDFLTHVIDPQLASIQSRERHGRGAIRAEEREVRRTVLEDEFKTVIQFLKSSAMRKKHLDAQIDRVRLLQSRGEFTEDEANAMIATLMESQRRGSMTAESERAVQVADDVVRRRMEQRKSQQDAFFRQRLQYGGPADDDRNPGASPRAARVAEDEANEPLAPLTEDGIVTAAASRASPVPYGAQGVLHPMRPPQRQQHALGATGGELRAAKKQTTFLALLDLRPLLNAERDDRDYWKGSEAQERSEITQLWEQQLDRVDQLIHRRRHLERLAMWRQQREVRELQQREYADVAQQLDDTVAEEAEEREKIVVDGMNSGSKLLSEAVAGSHQIQREHLGREEGVWRRALLSQEYIPALLSIVSGDLEDLTRAALIEVEWEREVVRTIFEPKQRELKELQEKWSAKRSKIVTIQRSFRRIRMGLAGWRCTHRRLGEWIAQRRGADRIAKQKAAVQSTLTAAQSELAALAAEEESHRAARRQKMIDAEHTDRNEVLQSESWYWVGIQSQHMRGLIHGIIMPNMRHLMKTEEPARREEIDRNEWYEGYHAIRCDFLRQRTFIQDKINFMNIEEPRVRSMITQHEERVFANSITADFKKGHAAVVQIEERRAQLHADERQAMCDEEELERQLMETEYISALFDVGCEHQRIMLTSLVLADSLNGWATATPVQREVARAAFAETGALPNQPDAFYGQFIDSVIETFVPWVEQLLRVHFTQELQIISSNSWAQFLEFFTGPEEQSDRKSIEESEANARREICVDAWNVDLIEVEKILEKKGTNAKVIQAFWRRYKNGEIGRSGMKRYLRAKFWIKREQAEIRREQARQKAIVEAANKQLEDAIDDHNNQTNEEWGDIIAAEWRRQERAREDILVEENFVRDIVEKNFVIFARDISAELVRNCQQHETYWRQRLVQEHQDGFINIFNPKKATFREDVLIRPGQRAWRCFMARRAQRERAHGALIKCENNEETHRDRIALEAFTELVTEVLRPVHLHQILATEYYPIEAPALLDASAIVEKRQIIAEEETERVEIFIHFHNSSRYFGIESVEATARFDMRSRVDKHAHQRLELEMAEQADRAAIARSFEILHSFWD